MPSLKIFTNLQRSCIPKDFVLKILPVLSKSVVKPEEKFVVTVNADVFQAMNMDNEAPSIVASLESIGKLGPEENKVIALALTDFMQAELGVKKEQIFITFCNLKASDVAKGGKTMG